MSLYRYLPFGFNCSGRARIEGKTEGFWTNHALDADRIPCWIALATASARLLDAGFREDGVQVRLRAGFGESRNAGDFLVAEGHSFPLHLIFRQLSSCIEMLAVHKVRQHEACHSCFIIVITVSYLHEWLRPLAKSWRSPIPTRT